MRAMPWLGAALTLLLLFTTFSAFAAEVPDAWRTHAERSNYRTTPNYQETLDYCRRLQSASPWVKLITYGTSGQGRSLPLLIVSKDRAFTPEAARRTGKAIVLIQNGIHSGEIEGKDASLALVRDLTVLETRTDLLDHSILLILPIFSVDAHERTSPYNRINQNGPENMGYRPTPVGLNLNRDYMKVEAPEMRALIGQVFTKWWPHLLVDNHTTDGADYQHDLTYSIQIGPVCPPAVERWGIEAFEGRVVPRIDAMGHLTAPYLSFRNGNDPASGFNVDGSTPRYSSGYPSLHGRPAILVETHMLKPYASRVRATYDLMVALLEELRDHPQALTGAVAEAEQQIVARGKANRGEVIALRQRATDRPTPFAYRGVVDKPEFSDVLGTTVSRYDTSTWNAQIPMYRELVPAVTTIQPAGYLIPQEWVTVRDRLDLHGVRYQRLASAWSDTVEVQHIAAWHAEERLREGHHPVFVDSLALERRWRTFRAGDLWVPLDQRSALVAIHLLEARAPDGLLYWNAFDTIFEQKEYAEDYVIEPIARRMLIDDPQLAREFSARIAADSTFAKSSAQRNNFFFMRSPWADAQQDRHPVVRAIRPPPAKVLGR
jgi:Zinc carboxypeptidase